MHKKELNGDVFDNRSIRSRHDEVIDGIGTIANQDSIHCESCDRELQPTKNKSNDDEEDWNYAHKVNIILIAILQNEPHRSFDYECATYGRAWMSKRKNLRSLSTVFGHKIGH